MAEELKTITGSSQITGVGYDAADQTLTVRFKKGGVMYRYFGVPETEYRGLVKAESVGKFFHRRIRPTYPVQKLSVTEEAA